MSKKQKQEEKLGGAMLIGLIVGLILWPTSCGIHNAIRDAEEARMRAVVEEAAGNLTDLDYDIRSMKIRNETRDLLGNERDTRLDALEQNNEL